VSGAGPGRQVTSPEVSIHADGSRTAWYGSPVGSGHVQRHWKTQVPSRAWWLLVLLAASACEPPVARSGTGVQCDLNSECEEPLVCRLARCRRQCATLRDCPLGARCVRDEQGLGACLLESEARCQLRSDCPAPLVCASGECVNECRDKRDCPPGAQCSEHDTCVQLEGTRCAFDSQCTDGLVCGPEGRCRWACLGDRDCRLGEGCSEHACVPITPSAVDAGPEADGGGDAAAAASDAGLDASAADGGMDAASDAAASSDASAPDAGSHPDAGASGDAGEADGGAGDPAPLECDGSCAAVPSGTVACVDGFCVVTGCDEGFLDCDGLAQNGCEANPETHRLHCGGCGMACATGEVCLEGACVIARAEQIAVGLQHACVLWSTGRITCWGHGGSGRLGDHGTSSRPVPVMVRGVSDAVRITAGSTHGCALRSDGSVVCWGSDANGQLGDGTVVAPIAEQPVTVTDLIDAVDVSAAATHTCAVREGGTVVCWGANTDGQLGIGSTSTAVRHAPVELALSGVLRVGARPRGGCAIGAAGELWCWGSNADGQLGTGATGTPELSPLPVTLPAGAVVRDLPDPLAEEFVVARTADGGVLCWGRNTPGHLCGLNDPASRVLDPQEHPFLSGVAVVATRCAARDDESLWCWAQNQWGQAGLGTTESPLDLPERADITGARAIATRASFGCALRGEEAEVRCAGSGASGQLGDGILVSHGVTRFSPVVGLP
jgi:hypothetical protein